MGILFPIFFLLPRVFFLPLFLRLSPLFFSPGLAKDVSSFLVGSKHKYITSMIGKKVHSFYSYIIWYVIWRTETILMRYDLCLVNQYICIRYSNFHFSEAIFEAIYSWTKYSRSPETIRQFKKALRVKNRGLYPKLCTIYVWNEENRTSVEHGPCIASVSPLLATC